MEEKYRKISFLTVLYIYILYYIRTHTQTYIYMSFCDTVNPIMNTHTGNSKE